MLLEIGLGKLGRRRAGDAEAVVHQLVAHVPRMRLADRVRRREDVPRGRRCRREGPCWALANAGEQWLQCELTRARGERESGSQAGLDLDQKSLRIGLARHLHLPPVYS